MPEQTSPETPSAARRSIYMIQTWDQDERDNSMSGSWIETISEDCGYFVSKESAQNFADGMMSQHDDGLRLGHAKMQAYQKAAYEAADREHQVLVAAGLRPPRAPQLFRETEWIRRRYDTRYVVVEIEPA